MTSLSRSGQPSPAGTPEHADDIRCNLLPPPSRILGVIEPLRKTSLSGKPYERTQGIEAKLVELSTLPMADLVRRSRVTRAQDPDYIPTECVIHFVRACRSHNSDRTFNELYSVLAERVLRRLPAPERRDGTTTALTPEAIRDDVFGRFTEMLASDRNSYSEKLDFFEIRFDQALARLRQTAQEKAWRLQNRSTALDHDEETGEPSPDVERAAAAFSQFEQSQIDDPGFRSRFDAAIDALPPMQGRIVEMIRKGIPIDSNDEGQITIARALGKSEKTIRSHRDVAYAALRTTLADGGDR